MKFRALVTILCIIFLLDPVSGFIQKRHQWWTVRINELQKEYQSVIAREDLDSRIPELISGELEQSRKAFKILTRRINGDSTLNEPVKEYTKKEVKEQVNRLVTPVAAAWYMDHILTALNDNSRIDMAEELVNKAMDELIKSAMGEKDITLRKYLVNELCDTYDQRIIALEVITIPVMKNSQNFISTACDGVLQSVTSDLEMPAKKTPSALGHTILEKALQHITAVDYPGIFRPDQSHLEHSWRWKEISSLTSIRLGHYKRIVDLAAKAGLDISPYRASRYYINPQAFEKEIFPRFTRKYRDSRKFKNYSDILDEPEDESRVHVISIPQRFDTGPALQSLDSIRKKKLPTLEGDEADEEYSRIRSSLQKEIKKKFTRLDNNLYREGQEIKRLREKAPGNNEDEIVFQNLNAFEDAKKMRNAKYRAAGAYARRCMEYLRIYGDSRARHGDMVTENYRYRVAQMGRYLDFIEDTGELISNCAYMTTPAVHNRMKDIAKRSRHMFRAYSSTLGLKSYERTSLNRENLLQVKELKQQARSTIQEHAVQFIRHCREYFTRYNTEQKKREEGNENLQKAIAQHEIDMLHSQLRAQMDLYARLTYGDTALEQYRQFFMSMETKAKEEPNDATLKEVLRSGSLFPFVKNASPQKIRKEHASMKYLHSKMRDTYASLITLDRWYARSGVTVDHRPNQAVVKNKMDDLTGNSPVTIASWHMTRENAAMIDRNAVHYLASLSKNTVATTPAAAMEMETHTLPVPDGTLSLKLPPGWSLKEVNNYYREKGITRQVQDNRESTVMNIGRIKAGAGSLQNSSHRWLDSMRYKPVKTGWRSLEAKKVYWTLARDSRGNVMEVYCIPQGESVYMIAGTSSREEYSRFSETFTRIMDTFTLVHPEK